MMELVKNPLPPEILAYKERHVWPLKTLYDKASVPGSVDQVEIARRLDTALSDYIIFAHEYAESWPNYGELMEGPLGIEMEWAFDECEKIKALLNRDYIRVPIRKAGRRLDMNEDISPLKIS